MILRVVAASLGYRLEALSADEPGTNLRRGANTLIVKAAELGAAMDDALEDSIISNNEAVLLTKMLIDLQARTSELLKALQEGRTDEMRVACHARNRSPKRRHYQRDHVA